MLHEQGHHQEIAEKQDNPGIKFPPPFIYLGFYFIGYYINTIDRIEYFGPLLRVFGMIIGLIGLLWMFGAFVAFRQHKTSVMPHAAASKLLDKGIFKFSRNPIYLGMAMTYLGMAFYRSNVWSILLLPIAMLMIDRFIIAREEAYLTRRFGEEYEDYKRNTRRWL